MPNTTIKQLVIDCSNLSSEMSISYGQVAPSFIFSNTGRRNGAKYFAITLPQIISVLENIKDNLSEFSKYPNYNESHWRDLFPEYITDKVINALSTVQTLPLFALLNKIITVVNNDIYHEKTIDLTPQKLQTTIDYLKNQMPSDEEITVTSNNSSLLSINKIYYGAPGTGKSHKINEITKDKICIRTVFHPDMQYTDFVGSLKPKTYIDDDKIKRITYEFRAGPFTKALIQALNNQLENVFLIIEEINRAQAPAVFGEIFQLLDRDESGRSKYNVDISDPDMLDYINGRINNKIDSIYIPSNLSILATMNSSDQAVMPMDTAFKRRWQFEYLLIDLNAAADGIIPLEVNSGNDLVSIVSISWKDMASIINNTLKSLNIPEDRLLGQYFLNSVEINSIDSARESFASKVLVYIWDDVLRHGKRNFIFNAASFNTFGEIYNAFKNGIPIFNASIEEQILINSSNSGF